MNDLDVSGEQPLVLLADDDDDVRFLMRELLEEVGFAVVEAADGVQTLSVFKQLRPHMVLLDVMMPGMDGFAACDGLRKLPGGDHVPILMITGLDDMESITHAYEVGATDFITKPINWMILGHRVRYMWRASLAADRLRKSEERNRALINAIPDLMFQVSRGGTILDFKVPKDFNAVLSPEKLVGKKIGEAFFAKAAQPITEHIGQALKTGDTQVFEHQAEFDGTLYFYEMRIVAGAEDELLAIVRDITERKRAEEQIRASLQEKEMMLKEIHHRVKNNLQIISSLLSLQSGQIGSKQPFEVFNDCKNRVHSMAAIHETLYRSEDFSKINFVEYLQELVPHLFQSFQANTNIIKANIEGNDVLLDINRAIPCALIVTELVSNCLKYAFAPGMEGRIDIAIRSNEDKFMLSVKDNGIGLVKDFDFQNTKTLGLKLVARLVRQLNGSLELVCRGGAEFRIEFRKTYEVKSSSDTLF